MISEHFTAALSNDTKCEVCGCVIGHLESLQLKDLDYSVCQSFECRRIMSQKPFMTPLLFQSHLQIQTKIYNERSEKEAARKKARKEMKTREQQENQRILQSVLEHNPELSKNNTHVVAIPKGLSRLVVLSEERINNYTEHLRKIIREAMEHDDSSEVKLDQHHDVREKLNQVERRFSENPVLRTVSDSLCSMCKGGCCTSGREHAYLTAITIKRYLAINSDISAADLLDLYLTNISSETIDCACINQTETGCVLPKELRSDICNSFYCDSLLSYQEKLAGEDPGTVLAVQRDNSCWMEFKPDTHNEIVNVALVCEQKIQYQDLSMQITITTT